MLDVSSSNMPYSFAVDIWGAGKLAIFLVRPESRTFFEGISSSQSYNDVGMHAFIDEFVHDLNLSVNAALFFKGCMRVDASKRLTADGMRRHGWFRESREDRLRFKAIERDAVKGWKGRDSVPDIELV